MTKNNLYRKSKKHVVLSFWQTIGHYSFMLVPLLIPGIELFYKIIGKTTVNTFSTSTQLILVLASLIIGYFKFREPNYYELEEPRIDKEFENAVLAAANKLKWRINYLDKNKAIARGYNPWKSRDAQTIKIERLNNKVLINSMIEQDFISVPDFLGINRTNRNTFLQYYFNSNKIENLNEKVIQHLKDEKEKIENEPEWSLKNTLMRLIAYIFCFGFLGIGFAIWKYEGFNLAVVLLIIIGLSYFLFDIYVMWTKLKKAS